MKRNNYYAITTIEQLRLEKEKLYRKVQKQEFIVLQEYHEIVEPFRIVKKIANAISQFASSYWAVGLSLGYKWLKQYLADRFAQQQEKSDAETNG